MTNGWSAVGRWSAATASAAVGLAAGFVASSSAGAGVYHAVSCGGGALAPETATFTTSGAGRTAWAGLECSSARHDLFAGAPGEVWTARSGGYGEWTISAPPGLRFRGGSFQAAPKLTDGVAAEYRFRIEGHAEPTAPEAITGSSHYTWPPPRAGEVAIDQLILRAYCAPASGCSYDSGRDPVPPGLSVSSLDFEIEDYSGPLIGTLGGPLTDGAAQRGTQLLAVPAADDGSGIANLQLRVNGKRYASQDPGCALSPDGRALWLSPCPTRPTVQAPVDTTSPPFVEGKNSIEACVTDYAEETNDPESLAAEACTTGGVYVDNSCPVSEGPDAAGLRFGFGRNAKHGQTVGFGKRARVRTRLRSATGEPIQGATVCLSERDRLGRARERDVETLTTNRRGNASARLPKGASRDLKLTYWSNDEDVETETARLNVRARPRLRVLSKRKLSDGGEVRFRVTLPGEYRRGRRVAVQALAPAGWLDFPGCVGRTNKKGDFACSYHFREQSGSVKYKFRALAPRQPGYPYLQGRSRSEKLIVRD